MRWTERQRAMLREMGVQLWSREPELVEAGVAPETEVERRPAPAPTSAARSTQALPVAPVDAPSIASAVQPADWLVVAEPLDPADKQQEQLLTTCCARSGPRARVRRGGRAASSQSPSAPAPAAPPLDDRALVAAAITRQPTSAA